MTHGEFVIIKLDNLVLRLLLLLLNQLSRALSVVNRGTILLSVASVRSRKAMPRSSMRRRSRLIVLEPSFLSLVEGNLLNATIAGRRIILRINVLFYKVIIDAAIRPSL
jgi:hypothetical protein